MQCSRCRAENRQGRRFCAECGGLAGVGLSGLRVLERARRKILWRLRATPTCHPRPQQTRKSNSAVLDRLGALAIYLRSQQQVV